ncbi:MAG: hypothetical protein N2234_02650 [Planctomycetota bacterium]|nr:hypothetical protein [Planctomycetota bacterium]
MRVLTAVMAFVAFIVAVFALSVSLLPNLFEFEKHPSKERDSYSDTDLLRDEVLVLKRHNEDHKTIIASLQKEITSLREELEAMKRKNEPLKETSSIQLESRTQSPPSSEEAEQKLREAIRREVTAVLEEIKRAEHQSALSQKKEHIQKEQENELKWRMEELDRISEKLNWSPELREDVKQTIQRWIQTVYSIKIFAIETLLRGDIKEDEKNLLINEFKERASLLLKQDEDVLLQLLGEELYKRLKGHLKM